MFQKVDKAHVGLLPSTTVTFILLEVKFFSK